MRERSERDVASLSWLSAIEGQNEAFQLLQASDGVDHSLQHR